MAANINDKLVKGSSLFTTTLSSGISDSDQTIPLNSTSGLATDTAVYLTIDDRDADGNPTPALREVVKGVISGSNLINCTRGVEGTAQSHSSGAQVGDRFTKSHWNAALAALLENVNQDATWKPTIIYDANGNEQLEFSATSSAVNNLEVKNAATGNNPLLRSKGESNKGIDLIDSNGNEILKTTSTASAVNEFTVANAATGNGPSLSATGETNVDVNVASKGTGAIKLTPPGTGKVEATNFLSKGRFVNRVAKTNSDSPYSIAATDDLVSVDASGGATTVTLPTAASAAGRTITVLRTDDTPANALTVGRTSSQNINGSANDVVFYQKGQGGEFTSDGTGWWLTRWIGPRMLARDQITSNFITSATSETQVTNLSLALVLPPVPVFVEINAYNMFNAVTGTQRVYYQAWDGTVGSGTAVASVFSTSASQNDYAGKPYAKSQEFTAAGSKTYNASLHGGGVGNKQLSATSDQPASIAVYVV